MHSPKDFFPTRDEDNGLAKRIEEFLDVIPDPVGVTVQESPDFAPAIAGFTPDSPLIPVEDLEFDGDKEALCPLLLLCCLLALYLQAVISFLTCRRLFREWYAIKRYVPEQGSRL